MSETALSVIEPAEQLISCLPGCDASDAALELASLLNQEIEGFRKPVVTIGFGGHFKAGKSTLINSLLGTDLLPVDYRPETGVGCWLMPGHGTRAVIIDEQGGESEIDCSRSAISTVSSLIDRDTGEHRSEFIHANAIKIWLESSRILPGTCWVDTPGINDTGDMDERAKRDLLQADLVLWVMNSQAVLSEVEQRFLADYAATRGTNSIVFVLNVFLENDSLPEWEEYVTEYQAPHLNKIYAFMRSLDPSRSTEPLVISVSARAMATQPSHFNSDQLRKFLRRDESFTERLWLARAERLAAAVARHERDTRDAVEKQIKSASEMRANLESDASSHLTKAWTAFDGKNYKDMLLKAGAAADCAPWMVEPHVARGIALAFEREFKYSDIAASRALRLVPDSLDARFVRVWAQVESGAKLNGARADLDLCLNSPRSWMKTMATWLRARALARTDPSCAARDLIAAAGDAAGLARISLTSSAVLFAAGHCFEAAHLWTEATTTFGRALETVPGEPETAIAASYDKVKETFKIVCVEATTTCMISRRLWDCCRNAFGSSNRRAAEAFWKVMQQVKLPDGFFNWEPDLFSQDENFFVHSASIFAESNDATSVIFFLQQIVSLQPTFDVRRFKRDKHIKASRDEAIVDALSVKYTAEWKAGPLNNYFRVINASIFRLTNIHIKITVVRSTGAQDTPLLLTATEVGPQDSLSWNDIFKDVGLFGNKISSVVLVSFVCNEA